MPYQLAVPIGNVSVHGGVLEHSMHVSIDYLLRNYGVDEMLWCAMDDLMRTWSDMFTVDSKEEKVTVHGVAQRVVSDQEEYTTNGGTWAQRTC